MTDRYDARTALVVVDVQNDLPTRPAGLTSPLARTAAAGVVLV